MTPLRSIAELRDHARRRRDLPSPELRRAIRTASGTTQLEVASALGVQRATIARYEAGTRTPRGELLDAYLAALRALK